MEAKGETRGGHFISPPCCRDIDGDQPNKITPTNPARQTYTPNQPDEPAPKLLCRCGVDGNQRTEGHTSKRGQRQRSNGPWSHSVVFIGSIKAGENYVRPAPPGKFNDLSRSIIALPSAPLACPDLHFHLACSLKPQSSCPLPGLAHRQPFPHRHYDLPLPFSPSRRVDIRQPLQSQAAAATARAGDGAARNHNRMIGGPSATFSNRSMVLCKALSARHLR